jgi:hypothetical protein
MEEIEIVDVSHIPLEPTTEDRITIKATITGPVKKVEFEYCSLTLDSCYPILDMVPQNDDIYQVTIGPLGAGEYEYKVIVEDISGKQFLSNSITLNLSETAVETDGDGVADAGDDAPWYEVESVVILICIIASIITLIIIVGVLTSRSKSKEVGVAAVKAPAAQQASLNLAQPEMEKISCPNCGTVFSIPRELRPMKVQCPSCKISGIIE